MSNEHDAILNLALLCLCGDLLKYLQGIIGFVLNPKYRERGNTFDALTEAGKVCSLGSMSHALYDVGGEYRRNM